MALAARQDEASAKSAGGKQEQGPFTAQRCQCIAGRDLDDADIAGDAEADEGGVCAGYGGDDVGMVPAGWENGCCLGTVHRFEGREERRAYHGGRNDDGGQNSLHEAGLILMMRICESACQREGQIMVKEALFLVETGCVYIL